MFNMDKITRTKIAMLVTLVLMNIFATIALLYMMTVSNVSNLGSGDPVVLNMAMVFAVMIAFMWVVILVLFYEFKTDDIIKTHIHVIEKKVVELEEYKQMLQDTVYTKPVMNPDILKEGGITGHIPSK
jgi:ABC-type multidrug transport system fused ATPase/permease subunit